MRVRLAATLIASVLVAGCISPGDEGIHRRGAPAELTFEEFVDQAYLEPWEGGVWIVDGDTPVGSVEELREVYDRLGTRQRTYGGGDAPADNALTINTVGGSDDRWADDRKRDLSYCVSRTAFAGRYDEVVRTMADAASAWEAVADVGFRHATEEDAACDASNPRVVFDVRPVDSDGAYLARAFFPSDPRAQRNVLIDVTAFEPINGGWTLLGVMRHELGHVLGFRHEHTRAEAGTCFEDNSHRPLTPYDRESVMHYPHCNGDMASRLEITPVDATGAASVYGAPGGDPAPRPDEPAPLDPDLGEPDPLDPYPSETPPDPPPEPDPSPDPAPSDCVTGSGVLFPGEIHRYPPLAVPSGRTVSVSTTGVGDPDLYAWMDGSAGGCASEGPDANESCSVASTGASLMVEVYGFNAATYELTVCW